MWVKQSLTPAGVASGGHSSLSHGPRKRAPFALGPSAETPRPGPVSPCASISAGQNKVYFGDRPMFSAQQFPSLRSPTYAEAAPTQGVSRADLGLCRTPSRSGSLLSSVRGSSHSPWMSPSNQTRGFDLPMALEQSSHVTTDHGYLCADRTLQGLPSASMQRTGSAPGNLENALKASRSRNEIFAGNVYKGSRSMLLGM
mmetsp:Transcript_27852/g.62972  ORF Transcript_27852/g.62972 Transcript_27852/m.62972 type:complete len:199 (-) Transcript_27852:68-664(-)